jgi:hypothetical protein
VAIRQRGVPLVCDVIATPAVRAHPAVVKDASGAPATASIIAPRQVVEHHLHENRKQDLEF